MTDKSIDRPDRKGNTVPTVHRALPFAILLALGACAADIPPGSALMATPGRGKDQAAFQQDDQICRRHAVDHTGYAVGATPQTPTGAAPQTPIGATPLTTPGAAAPATAGTAATAPPGAAPPPDDLAYFQCMAARGDTVQPVTGAYPLAGTTSYAYGPYGYSPGYPYPYGPYGYGPYAYGYPGDFYGGPFFGGLSLGFGFGGYHRGYGGRWYGGPGWHASGWHGSGWHGGGWHGGGGHGGGHR